MSVKKTTTKEKIIDAAWKLFVENGYEETTLQDIILESGTSRGAFYHHFRAKEDLLFQMAWYFDKEYDNWLDSTDPKLDAIEKLSSFDVYAITAIENSPYRSFLPQLYGYEVMTDGRRYILDEDRQYFKTVLALIKEGQSKGEIMTSTSCYNIARTYASLQRALVYSWLLEKCRYSLMKNAHGMMLLYLNSIRMIPE